MIQVICSNLKMYFVVNFNNFLRNFKGKFLYVYAIPFIWLSKSDIHLVMFDSGLEKQKEHSIFIYASIFVGIHCVVYVM
jgi:hypothetical protein